METNNSLAGCRSSSLSNTPVHTERKSALAAFQLTATSVLTVTPAHQPFCLTPMTL